MIRAYAPQFKDNFCKPSAFDLKVQHRSLNQFVKEYNHSRSHEFLGMKTPADGHDFTNKP
jgi:transposase InsO family protein